MRRLKLLGVFVILFLCKAHAKEMSVKLSTDVLNNEVCRNADFILKGLITGGVEDYHVYLNHSAGYTLISDNNFEYEVSLSSDTYISVMIIDAAQDTISDSILVKTLNKPLSVTISNSPASACSGEDISFTPSVSNANGEIEYSWSYDGSLFSEIENPVQSFDAFGCTGVVDYDINLYVTDENKCTGSISNTISINKRPELTFIDSKNYSSQFSNCDNSPTSLDPTFEIELTNNSSDVGCITSYDVDWGDGNIDTTATFPLSHTYNKLGAFTLVVTGYSPNGCDGIFSTVVKNQSVPAGAILGPENTLGCEPLLIPFQLVGYANNSPGTYYVFDFGDGDTTIWDYSQPFINDTVWHEYTSSSCNMANQEFIASVNIVNTCKSKESTVNTIIVYDNPEADVRVGSEDSELDSVMVCVDENVQFYNASTAGNYGVDCSTDTKYSWIFEDDTTVTYTNSTQYHTFTDTGTYIVELWSENPCGASYDEVKVIVTDPPKALFSIVPTIGCAPLPVQTTNASVGKYIHYAWSVDPNANYSFTSGYSASENPELTFTASGTYTITLQTYNGCASDYESHEVTVIHEPVLQIDTIINYCESATISPGFTNTGDTADSYNWLFTSGTPVSSTDALPANIQYNNPGNYEVILNATNICGTGTDTMRFEIEAQPEVLVNNSSLCNTETSVSISAITNNLTSFQWETTNGSGTFVDDEQISTNYNLSETDQYLDELKLVATGFGTPACGDSIDTLTIDIVQLSEIDAGNDIIICKYVPVDLNASVSYADSIRWKSLGDGLFDNEKISTPVYSPGTGDISNENVKLILTAYPQSPCIDIIRDTLLITLVDPPVANAGSDSTLCTTQFTVFDASVSNSIDYSWSHSGDGTFSNTDGLTPTYSVSEDDYTVGKVDIYLRADVNGCESAYDTATLTLPLLPALSMPDNASICENGDYPVDIEALNYADIQLSNNGSGSLDNETGLPSTYLISEGDITNGEVSIYAEITGNNPCPLVLSDSTRLTIVQLPVIDSLPDKLIGEDEDLTIDFANANNYSSVQWETLGSGSFSDENDLNTIYDPSDEDIANEFVQIILIAYSNSPCDESVSSVSDTFMLQIVPKPIFDAGADYTICEGSNFEMAIGHASAERYSRLYWETNGTGTLTDSTTLTPSYVPSEQDIENRSVTFFLNVAGEAPIEDMTFTDSMHLIIQHNAIIDLVAVDTFCEGSSYTPATYSESDVDGYDWISNSISGYFNNHYADYPQFTPGDEDITDSTVTIYVEVSSIAPCVATDADTTVLTILHIPRPDFEFTPDSGCGPLVVDFTNTSTGEELSYEWSFGDFSNITVTHPQDIVFEAGIIADTSYNVTLTTTNRCSTEDITKNVIVLSDPTARFANSPSWGCSPVDIEFLNTSLGLPTKYSWDWGDGSAISTETEPGSHVFTTGDEKTNYTITLIASNDCGIDTITDVITVFPNTVDAFFEVDTNIGCAPLTVKFTNSSRGAAGSEPFLEWSWNFGDGSISDTKNPVHEFTNPGTYEVMLYVHDSCAYDTAITKITVMGANEVNFSLSDTKACMEDTISFTTTDLDYSKTGNLLWVFADGDSTNNVSAKHAYDTAGTFTVELIATSIINGCTAATEQEITIYQIPVSSFTPSVLVGCMPLRVNFDNNSLYADYYSWIFEDEYSSIKTEDDHTFDTAGTYSVMLAVSNNECADTSYQQIIVNPIPQSNFNISADQSCFYPVTVDLTNTSSGYDANKWIILNDSTTKHNPSFTFEEVGTYPILLVCYNSYECTDTARYDFNVYNNPIADFYVLDAVGCDPYNIDFVNATTYGSSYTWSINGTDTSHSENANYLLEGAGTYTIELIAVGDGNCSDTIVKDEYITVNPSPVADFEYQQVNDADTVEFWDYSTGSTGQTWYFGDGDTSNISDPLHKYPSYGSYFASLLVYNEFACTDTLTKEVILEYYKGLFLPTGMSPDNASEDVRYFVPSGIGLSSLQIVIYDSWGNKLWETTSLKNGIPNEYWDGTDLDGNPLPPDTYFWHINEATYKDGTSYEGERYGIIMIVK